MRKARILYKDEAAGTLIQHDDGSFTFEYDDAWFVDSQKPGISLTLPKSIRTHHSKYLFPFFYQLLPEGSNKELICNYHKIDKDDAFGLLIITAVHDAIGAVTVIKI